MVFHCCYQCEVRTIDCHTNCPSYLAECKENEERKKWDRYHNPPSISKGSFIGNAISSHKHRRD